MTSGVPEQFDPHELGVREIRLLIGSVPRDPYLGSHALSDLPP